MPAQTTPVDETEIPLRDNPNALLRIQEVAALMDVSISFAWYLVGKGVLPQPIRMSPRCSRWRLGDIERAIAAL